MLLLLFLTIPLTNGFSCDEKKTFLNLAPPSVVFPTELSIISNGCGCDVDACECTGQSCAGFINSLDQCSGQTLVLDQARFPYVKYVANAAAPIVARVEFAWSECQVQDSCNGILMKNRALYMLINETSTYVSFVFPQDGPVNLARWKTGRLPECMPLPHCIIGCGGTCGRHLRSHYNETQIGDELFIHTNGIPNHMYGAGVDLGRVCEQKHQLRIPLYPQEMDESVPVGVGPIGVLKSGVVLYSPIADSGGGIRQTSSSDIYNGYTNTQCGYQMHKLDSTNQQWKDCEHIGYMRDGFPIYSQCRKRQIYGSTSLMRSCYKMEPGRTGSDESHYRFRPNDCELDQYNGYDFSGQGFLDSNNNPIEGWAYVATESFPFITSAYKGTPGELTYFYGEIPENKHTTFEPRLYFEQDSGGFKYSNKLNPVLELCVNQTYKLDAPESMFISHSSSLTALIRTYDSEITIGEETSYDYWNLDDETQGGVINAISCHGSTTVPERYRCLDECGVANGFNLECTDECGVVFPIGSDRANWNKSCLACDTHEFDYLGIAKNDSCGVCRGSGSPCVAVDACGVDNGDNSTCVPCGQNHLTKCPLTHTCINNQICSTYDNYEQYSVSTDNTSPFVCDWKTNDRSRGHNDWQPDTSSNVRFVVYDERTYEIDVFIDAHQFLGTKEWGSSDYWFPSYINWRFRGGKMLNGLQKNKFGQVVGIRMDDRTIWNATTWIVDPNPFKSMGKWACSDIFMKNENADEVGPFTCGNTSSDGTRCVSWSANNLGWSAIKKGGYFCLDGLVRETFGSNDLGYRWEYGLGNDGHSSYHAYWVIDNDMTYFGDMRMNGTEHYGLSIVDNDNYDCEMFKGPLRMKGSNFSQATNIPTGVVDGCPVALPDGYHCVGRDTKYVMTSNNEMGNNEMEILPISKKAYEFKEHPSSTCTKAVLSYLMPIGERCPVSDKPKDCQAALQRLNEGNYVFGVRRDWNNREFNSTMTYLDDNPQYNSRTSTLPGNDECTLEPENTGCEKQADVHCFCNTNDWMRGIQPDSYCASASTMGACTRKDAFDDCQTYNVPVSKVYEGFPVGTRQALCVKQENNNYTIKAGHPMLHGIFNKDSCNAACPMGFYLKDNTNCSCAVDNCHQHLSSDSSFSSYEKKWLYKEAFDAINVPFGDLGNVTDYTLNKTWNSIDLTNITKSMFDNTIILKFVSDDLSYSSFVEASIVHGSINSISNVNFAKCYFDHLSSKQLDTVYFTNGIIKNAVFTEFLMSVTFSGATLSNTNFSNVILSDVDFSPGEVSKYIELSGEKLNGPKDVNGRLTYQNALDGLTQACTGECDNIWQCAAGLQCTHQCTGGQCSQRGNGENIPGCKGDYEPTWDFCYDPSWTRTYSITTLDNVDFSGAALDNVDFSNATLNNVNFSGATLNNVNFTGSVANNVDFVNTSIVNSRFASVEINTSDWSLSKWDNVDLSGAKLKNIINVFAATYTAMSFVPNLHMASFQGIQQLNNAYLPNTDWSTHDKTGWTFINSTLDKSTFLYQPSNHVDFSFASLIESKFTGTPCKKCIFTGSDVSASIFVGANLVDAVFTNANAEGANFEGANLTNALFTNANAKDANFEGAILTNVTFTETDLINANFAYADLSFTRLQNVNIENVNFDDINAYGMSMSNVYGQLLTCPTILPSGNICIDNFIVGPDNFANISVLYRTMVHEVQYPDNTVMSNYKSNKLLDLGTQEITVDMLVNDDSHVIRIIENERFYIDKTDENRQFQIQSTGTCGDIGPGWGDITSSALCGEGAQALGLFDTEASDSPADGPSGCIKYNDNNGYMTWHNKLRWQAPGSTNHECGTNTFDCICTRIAWPVFSGQLSTRNYNLSETSDNDIGIEEHTYQIQSTGTCGDIGPGWGDITSPAMCDAAAQEYLENPAIMNGGGTGLPFASGCIINDGRTVLSWQSVNNTYPCGTWTGPSSWQRPGYRKDCLCIRTILVQPEFQSESIGRSPKRKIYNLVASKTDATFLNCSNAVLPSGYICINSKYIFGESMSMVDIDVTDFDFKNISGKDTRWYGVEGRASNCPSHMNQYESLAEAGVFCINGLFYGKGQLHNLHQISSVAELLSELPNIDMAGFRPHWVGTLKLSLIPGVEEMEKVASDNYLSTDGPYIMHDTDNAFYVSTQGLSTACQYVTSDPICQDAVMEDGRIAGVWFHKSLFKESHLSDTMYKEKTSGNCTDEPGWDYINSRTECELGTRELRLHYRWNRKVSVKSNPRGCILNGYDGLLRLNNNPIHSTCGSNGYRCVCKFSPKITNEDRFFSSNATSRFEDLQLDYFVDNNFNGLDLSNMKFPDVTFKNVSFKGVVSLSNASGIIGIDGSHFENVDVTGLDLSKIYQYGTDVPVNDAYSVGKMSGVYGNLKSCPQFGGSSENCAWDGEKCVAIGAARLALKWIKRCLDLSIIECESKFKWTGYRTFTSTMLPKVMSVHDQFTIVDNVYGCRATGTTPLMVTLCERLQNIPFNLNKYNGTICPIGCLECVNEPVTVNIMDQYYNEIVITQPICTSAVAQWETYASVASPVPVQITGAIIDISSIYDYFKLFEHCEKGLYGEACNLIYPGYVKANFPDSRYYCSGGVIAGPGVSFNNTDLTETSLDVLSSNVLRSINKANFVGCPKTLPPNWSCHGSPRKIVLVREALLGDDTNCENIWMKNMDLGTISTSQVVNKNFNGADWSGVFGDARAFRTTVLSPEYSVLRVPSEDEFVLVGPKVSLRRRSLMDVVLTDVDLSGADLLGMHASWTGTCGDIKLPDEWKCLTRYLETPISVNTSIIVGPYADLIGMSLNEFNLTGVSLAYALLDGLHGHLAGCPSHLPEKYGCNEIDRVVLGPGVNLVNMKITQLATTPAWSGNARSCPEESPNMYACMEGIFIGWQQEGMDLSNKNLTGLDLSGVDFRTSKFIDAYGQTAGCPQLPTTHICIDNYIVGPNVVLNGVNMSGWDMSPIKISNTKLIDSFGTLKNCPQSGIGYICIRNRIIGMGASLIDVGDVTNVNFKGVDFSLYDAVLSSLDLYGASGLLHGCFSNEKIRPLNFVCAQNRIIGPGVNVDDIDLSGYDPFLLNLTNVRGIVKACPPPATYRSDCVCTSANIFACKNVDMSNYNLTRVNFNKVNLLGINFNESNVTDATFEDTRGQVEVCPSYGLADSYKCIDRYIVGGSATGWAFNERSNGLDLSGLTLTNLRLHKDDTIIGTTLLSVQLAPDSTNVSFTGVVTGNIQCTNVSLPDDVYCLLSKNQFIIVTDVIRKILVRPVFENKTLKNWKCETGGGITGGYFKDVHFVNVDFSKCDLENTISINTMGTPAWPTNCQQDTAGLVICGQTIFDEVFVNKTLLPFSRMEIKFSGILTNINISGVDLSKMDFADTAYMENLYGVPEKCPASLPFMWYCEPENGLLGANQDMSGYHVPTITLMEDIDITNSNIEGMTFYAGTAIVPLDNVLFGWRGSNIQGYPANISPSERFNAIGDYRFVSNNIIGPGINMGIVTIDIDQIQKDMNLDGVDFSHSVFNCSECKFEIHYNSQVLLPMGYKRLGNYIIGPGLEMPTVEEFDYTFHGSRYDLSGLEGPLKKCVKINNYVCYSNWLLGPSVSWKNFNWKWSDIPYNVVLNEENDKDYPSPSLMTDCSHPNCILTRNNGYVLLHEQTYINNVIFDLQGQTLTIDLQGINIDSTTWTNGNLIISNISDTTSAKSVVFDEDVSVSVTAPCPNKFKPRPCDDSFTCWNGKVLYPGYVFPPMVLSGQLDFCLKGLDLEQISPQNLTLTRKVLDKTTLPENSSQLIFHNNARGLLQSCPSTLPSGWFCKSNRLISKHTHLVDIDVSDIDFSNIEFDTDLSWSNVIGQALACPMKLPSDWTCKDGIFIGKNVDYRDVILPKQVDLTGVDLSGSFFKRDIYLKSWTGMLKKCPETLPGKYKCIQATTDNYAINNYAIIGSYTNVSKISLSKDITFTNDFNLEGIHGSFSLDATNEPCPTLDTHLTRLGYACSLSTNFAIVGPGVDLSGLNLDIFSQMKDKHPYISLNYALYHGHYLIDTYPTEEQCNNYESVLLNNCEFDANCNI